MKKFTSHYSEKDEKTMYEERTRDNKDDLSKSSNPIRSTINTIFQNDKNIREAISENLKERTTLSKALAERVDSAFESFNPSKYATADCAPRNYLARDGDLSPALESVLTAGVEAIRNSNIRRSIKLHSNSELKSLITKVQGGNNSLVGTIELEQLINYITRKSGVPPALPNDPLLTSCQATLAAERRLNEIEGTRKSTDETEIEVDSHPGNQAATQLVEDMVNIQMGTATSPENQLRYAYIPNHAKEDLVQASLLQTFELRPGASDVTSYHDFNNLQIAFENVWTEVFDGQLAGLGRELYHEYIKLKEFNRIDEDDLQISTLADLQRLMTVVRDLSRITQDAIPPELLPKRDGTGENQPRTASDFFTDVKNTLPENALISEIDDATTRDVLTVVTDVLNPVKGVIDLFSAFAKLLGGKQKLTWNDFSGPLPGGNGDRITLSGKPGAAQSGWVQLEIVLGNGITSWKGFQLIEVSEDGTEQWDTQIGVENDEYITGDKITSNSITKKGTRNSITVPTNTLGRKVIELQKAGAAGFWTGFYRLGGLDQIKDGAQLTFTWEEDH